MGCDLRTISILEKACQSSSSSSSPSLQKLLPSLFSSTSTKARTRNKQQQPLPSVDQIQNLLLLATKYNNTDAVFDILCFFSGKNFSSRSTCSSSSSSNRKARKREDGSSNTIVSSSLSSLLILTNDDDSGDTLLHIMCREYGWNNCIELTLEYSLLFTGGSTTTISLRGGEGNEDNNHNSNENDNDNDDDDYDDWGALLSLALFTFNQEMETPLYLACEYGCSPFTLLSSILRLYDQRHNNSFTNVVAATATTTAVAISRPAVKKNCLSNHQDQLYFMKLISQFTSGDQEDNNKSNDSNNNNNNNNNNIDDDNPSNLNSELHFMLSTLLRMNPMIVSSTITNTIDDSVDDHCLGQSALHWACYYQNPSLIEYCLLHCSNSNSRSQSQPQPQLQLHSQSTVPSELHSLLTTRTRTTAATPSSSLSTAEKTPLDYLIMNLGSCDDQYTWQCLDVFVFQSIYPNFPLVRYIIENVNCYFLSTILLKKNVLHTILTRYGYGIDLHNHENDENNENDVRNILVSAIMKAKEWKIQCEKYRDMNDTCMNNTMSGNFLFYDLCEFFLQREYKCITIDDTTGTTVTSNWLQRLSNIRSNDTKHRYRLPLHIALYQNLTWRDGVSLLLDANVDTLEEVDIKTNLPPFLLAAAATSTIQHSVKGRKSSKRMSTDCGLDTIYELLRYRPTMIFV